MPIEALDTNTPVERYDIPTGQESDGFWDNVGSVMDKVNLDYGDNVAEESKTVEFAKYENYKQYQKEYDAYADNTRWYKPEVSENIDREIIDGLVESGRFTLDAENNLVDNQSTWASGFLYDEDMVKGALLAKQNGWTKDKASVAYKEYTATRNKILAKDMQNVGMGALATGMVLGHGGRETTLKEIAASPAKIVGKTILGGMAKAFVAEGGIAVAGEIEREARISRHKAKAEEEYTLWDSVSNIMIAAVFAGTLRALGSGYVDRKTLKKIRKDAGKLEATDQQILERFLQREQYRLTANTTKHLDMMSKAERDIELGQDVDVEIHAEVSIEDKVKELDETIDLDEVEEISLRSELDAEDVANDTYKQVEAIEKTIDEAPEVKPVSKTDPYEGRATSQEGDELLEDMAEFDPEIKAELEAIKAEEAALTTDGTEDLSDITLENPMSKRISSKKIPKQAEAVKDAAVPGIGADIDAEKEAVKNLFKKNTSEDAYYKKLSSEDKAEVERMVEENLENMGKDDFGNDVFAQGSGTFGGSMGGGVTGGATAAYEDIVEGKDVSLEQYAAYIAAGMVTGGALGKKYGKAEGVGTFLGKQKMYRSEMNEIPSVANSKGGNFGKGLYLAEDINRVKKNFNNGKILEIDVSEGNYLNIDDPIEANMMYAKYLGEDFNAKTTNFNTYKIVAGTPKNREKFNDFLVKEGYDGIVGRTPAAGNQRVLFKDAMILDVKDSAESHILKESN